MGHRPQPTPDPTPTRRWTRLKPRQSPHDRVYPCRPTSNRCSIAWRLISRPAPRLPSPSIAFTATTERLWGVAIHPAAWLSCRQCRTLPACAHGRWQNLAGGEKRARWSTRIAAHQAQRDSGGAQQADSRANHSGVEKPQPPYHLALRGGGAGHGAGFGRGQSVTRNALDTTTTVIVATRQAFQVEEEAARCIKQRRADAPLDHCPRARQRAELLSRR